MSLVLISSPVTAIRRERTDLADRAKRRNLSGASRTSIYGGFHDCNAIGAMQAVVIAYYGKASENLDAATDGLFGDGSS